MFCLGISTSNLTDNICVIHCAVQKNNAKVSIDDTEDSDGDGCHLCSTESASLEAICTT